MPASKAVPNAILGSPVSPHGNDTAASISISSLLSTHQNIESALAQAFNLLRRQWNDPLHLAGGRFV